MLDKKQIWAIFLLEFKMGYKAAEINCNINNTHAPGTAKERTVQSWLKKLSEGDESLEDEKRNDQPSEVDNDQLRRSSKLLLLQLHEKLPKNSTSTILQSFSIGSKLEKWNSLISGYLMSWLQVKKNQHFEVLSSFIVCNKNKPFLDRIVTRNEQCILYDNRQWPAQWLDREEAPKHFPKPKKGHGHCLMACCPSDPLQLSESWQNHYIWEVCPANEWDALKVSTLAASAGQQNEPNSFPRQRLTARGTTRASAVEQSGLRSYASSTIFTRLLANNYHCFTHLDNFLQGQCFHRQQEAEKGVQEPLESRTTDFYAIGSSKLISHWQKCVNCKGSYFGW